MAAVYKDWRLTCSKCRGNFDIKEWNDRLPKMCKCGGYFFQASDPIVGVDTAPRISTQNEALILADIEGRWPEHLGG